MGNYALKWAIFASKGVSHLKKQAREHDFSETVFFSFQVALFTTPATKSNFL